MSRTMLIGRSAVLLLSLLAGAVVSAQPRNEFETVGGLTITRNYSGKEIVSMLGEPDTVTMEAYIYYHYSMVPRHTSERGPLPEEEVMTDSFGFTSYPGGVFNSYFIYTDRYAFTHPSVPGVSVRVGDPISKVRAFPGTFHDNRYGDGKGELYWCPEGFPEKQVDWMMYPYFCYDSKGIITSIEHYYD